MQQARLFELARSRAKLPDEFILLNYRKETDLLAIKFSDKKSAYSRADMPEGIIYDYDFKDNLVSVEILDFYESFPKQKDNELAAEVTIEREIKKVERAARRKNRKRKIVRHCCKKCGQPKHYICLEHGQKFKQTIFKRLPKKFKYYTKKFYFNVAQKLGFEV
jgi:uncharacterized protein YuzE